MIPEPVWDFPLLAVAVSARRLAYVAMDHPLSVEASRTWETRRTRRSEEVANRIARACAWHAPRTVLVTHGSRWNTPDDLPDLLRGSIPMRKKPVVGVGLDRVSDLLGCDPKLPAIVDRLVDAYTEVADQFACIESSHSRTDAVRNARPLLSALAIAHAASVAHIIKFG